MSLRMKVSMRRAVSLMTSLFLVGFIYVIMKTDRLFVRRDLSLSLSRRGLLLQRHLAVMGFAAWGPSKSPSNETRLQGNRSELSQNATDGVQQHGNLTTSARNPEFRQRDPAPFDPANPLRGYVSVSNRSKQLDMRCGVCALVSSSGQLLHYKAGNEIDQADCVIRMNDAPVPGHEVHVGSRTTLRVSCFQSILLVRTNSPLYARAGKYTLLGWGPAKEMDTAKGRTYRKLAELNRAHRDLDVYMLTQDRMGYSGEVFRNETGKTLEASGSWLSTGWFTMLVAMEICDVVKVYGMSSEDYCRTHSNDTTKYHYYKGAEPRSSTATECHWYNWHHKTRKGAHRFFTEKSVYARWATKNNITFHYPSWTPS